MCVFLSPDLHSRPVAGKNRIFWEDQHEDVSFLLFLVVSTIKFVIQNFDAGMCGPVSQCCCCFPALGGVRFIAGLHCLLELAGLTYNTIILVENNQVGQQCNNPFVIYVLKRWYCFLLVLCFIRCTFMVFGLMAIRNTHNNFCLCFLSAL